MDDENQEQFYWLQLLSDLGTNRVVDVSPPEKVPSSPDYFYLDKLSPVDVNPELHQDHFWLYGKDVPGSAGPEVSKKSIDSSDASVSHDEGEMEVPEVRTSRIESLNESLEFHSEENQKLFDDRLWANEYPAALELVRNEMLFQRLEFDLDSVNENDDESGFEIINYTNRPMSARDMFLLQIPSRSEVSSAAYSMLRLDAVQSNVIKLLDQLASMIPADDISHFTKKSLRSVLQIALEHFQRVKSHAVVSSLVGFITESSIVASEQVHHLYSNTVSQLSPRTTEEMKYLQRLQGEIGWQNISLRYCMSSVAWRERQLIKETREESNDITNMSQFRERFNALLSSQPDLQQYYSLQGNSSQPSVFDILSRDTSLSPGSDHLSSESQKLLLKVFTPPTPLSEDQCFACQKPFTLTSFRHSCVYCGHCFCDLHLSKRRKIYRYGIVTPTKVCDSCCATIDEISRRDQLMWKDHRVSAFLRGELIRYQNTPSTPSRRLNNLGEDSILPSSHDHSTAAWMKSPWSLLWMGQVSFSHSYSKQMIQETLMLFRKNKIHAFDNILMKETVVESTEAIKKIFRLHSDHPVSEREITACIYYKLMIEREFRGCDPEREHNQVREKAKTMSAHPDAVRENYIQLQKEEKKVEEDLSFAIRYAPIALNVINSQTPEDMQRLSSLQGLELLFTNVQQESENVPAVVYGVFATENSFPQDQALSADSSEKVRSRKLGQSPPHSDSGNATKKREVIVAVRALPSFDDILHEIQDTVMATFPIDERIISQYLSGEIMVGQEYNEFLATEVKTVKEEESSDIRYANKTIVLGALQLLLELGPSLLRFYSANYDISLVGHGYGGSIVSLAALMLQSAMLSNHAIKAVAYGPLPFIDLKTADDMKSFVLTVVLHDDIVSRLTKESCFSLVEEVTRFKAKVFNQPNQSWNFIRTEYFSTSLSSDPEQVQPKVNEGEVSRRPLTNELSVFLGGRVFLFYFNRGQYRPCHVERTFPSLRNIEFQDHLLKDHRGSSILNALLEARAAKVASSVPPRWVRFDENVNCSCCKQRFSWISSFEMPMMAAEDKSVTYRQKFNCRSCGSLVCGDCSSNYRSIGKYGMVFPRRICDKCMLSGEFITA